jgi:hypothetical protein
MIRRPSPDGPLLVNSLRDVLSRQAISRLELLDVRRDLQQTCSEEELRAALTHRGLPIYESVLEFERRCGGTFWPLHGTLDRLGTWVAIRNLEWPGRPSPPELLIECEGERLLPISAHRGGCDFWMSEGGIIFFCDDIDWNPTADSYTIFLERESLKWGSPEQLGILLRWYELPTMTEEDFVEIERRLKYADVNVDEPPRPYAEDPQAGFDRRLAEALELPLFEPATDRWRHVWFDGSRLLFPYYPWRESERLLRANDMDDIVRIVRAAQDVRPGVVATWRGPCGEAPKAGEPIAARIQAYDYRRDVYGELLFIGTPGNFRVHEIGYDQRISAFRLWNEREEAWKATRSVAASER